MFFSRRHAALLLALSAIFPVHAYAEPNACSESENQSALRTELANQYGVKRHKQTTPPDIWTLEAMDSKPDRLCEVSCRNNTPYDNFYLSYHGIDASGKPCQGQTTVVMTTSQGLLKMLAACMAGCHK